MKYPVSELSLFSKLKVTVYPEWFDAAGTQKKTLAEIHREELNKRRIELQEEIQLLEKRILAADTRGARNDYIIQRMECQEKLKKLDLEMANREPMRP